MALCLSRGPPAHSSAQCLPGMASWRSLLDSQVWGQELLTWLPQSVTSVDWSRTPTPPGTHLVERGAQQTRAQSCEGQE